MKTIISDLDGTLAESKSPIQPDMADAIHNFLDAGNAFAVISGGMLEQLVTQVADRLPEAEHGYEHLYFLPTSGASMYKWNGESWQQVYENNFTEEEKDKVVTSLNRVVEKHQNLFPDERWGEQFEDRHSQISFSALGQQAPVAQKKVWDPDKSKRKLLVSELNPLLPEFRVAYGGSTTIDITKKGIDKSYGINHFFEKTGFDMADAVFIGDALGPQGNDYPAYKTDIDVKGTSGPSETIEIIERQLSKK